MFVIGLAAFDFRIAVAVELASLFLYLRLTAKEHALGTNHPCPPGVGKRSEDMEDEGVIPIARGRAMKARASPEAAIRVFVAILPEDFLLEIVLLLLVIRLLFGLEPPEII